MIVVAAAVIRAAPGAPVLLTQRMRGAHLEGLWEFPGGKVEAGEDPERTVVRECLEEIALEVEVRGVLEVAWHGYPDKDVLLIFYDCRVVSGELAHLGVADSAWVEPSSLDDYELPPPDRRLVAKLRAEAAGLR